jgi:endonuclease YncB( thermonuclease family)
VVDGDTAKLHLDLGFGIWTIATTHPGSTKEAKYPQGVYRLYGIDTPEKHGASKAAGLESMARVNELLSLGNNGDSIIVKTDKKKVHGKYRIMLRLFVPVDTKPLPFEVEDEEPSWLSDEDLLDLVAQSKPGGTVRAMATELLARRQPEKSVIDINQTLLDEGLAEPYYGGKKKR